MHVQSKRSAHWYVLMSGLFRMLLATVLRAVRTADTISAGAARHAADGAVGAGAAEADAHQRAHGCNPERTTHVLSAQARSTRVLSTGNGIYKESDSAATMPCRQWAAQHPCNHACGHTYRLLPKEGAY